MIYCGMWEYKNWQDNTAIWIHEWVRVIPIKPFGLRFETYTFGTYRKYLPKEIE